jgi:uncharacterized hydrophobic protein (TIGR00271 family)
VLRLRTTTGASARDELVGALERTTGVHRVTSERDACQKGWVVSADLSPVAADKVLASLQQIGVDRDDYVIVRQDVIAPRFGPASLTHAEEGFSWAEVMGEARANSRPIARYVILMMVAGWIAGLGVITDNSILIIGAMAVSPDLLPVCATCVGFVGRRLGLAARAFGTLAFGLLLVMIVAAVLSYGLEAVGILDAQANNYLGGLRGLAEVNYTTVMVALAAGVAAILSFETRAAATVGVAISVTTMPASAFFGVAMGLGETSRAYGALEVLAINLALMIFAGSMTLATQRWLAPRE